MIDETERIRQAALVRLGRELAGRYRLEALLGFGGTAAVYVAWNTVVQRRCAVKILHGEHRDNPEVVERFKREAYVANRVRFEDDVHPNVADILDAGESDGCLFLVQELLKGETLAAFLDRQPGRRVTPEVALALLRPIVHAVAAAHHAGVVHRDIKPENIFLVDRASLGRPVLPKILDFGIAQLVDARITHRAMFQGTPTYMPPEAYTDPQTVDARMDVWALGLVLYEMIAGRNPFARDEGPWYAHAFAVQTEMPPSLAAHGAEPVVRALVRRCLSKRAAERYPDAGALLAALDAALDLARTFDVPAGASVDEVQARLRASGRRWNGLKIMAPWCSAGEVLALAALPELAHLRALVLATAPDVGVSEQSGMGALPRPPRGAAGDEMAAAVAGSADCAHLVTLEIAGGGTTAAGAAALSGTAVLAQLAALILPRNRVGDYGAMALAQSPHLQWLESLDLSRNGIGDVGARALAASTALPSLAALDLSHNRITDEAARALADAPGLAALRVLDLTGNPVSAETAAWLRARPGRTVRA